MTSKTGSSVTLKSLKGIFQEPKMNHRRDFLRENKLSLRDLQKSTTQKLAQQKEENENRQYKHLQKHKIDKQEHTSTRRSASGSRSNDQNCKRQSTLTARAHGGGGDADTEIKAKSNLVHQRASSQQRQKIENPHTSLPCCCMQKSQHGVKQNRELPRSSSSVSVSYKSESCDKEIQTEDIQDEDFLYEALKKCTSFASNPLLKQETNNKNLQHSDLNYNLQQHENALNSEYSNQKTLNGDEYNNLQHDQISQYTSRSQNTQKSNHYHQDPNIENDINKDLEQGFRDLKIAEDMRREQEAQLSARSRQTNCSTRSKRSHKLGDREDVRLPRYLEKEKREKEEERLRELSKDLNCPMDHYALSEEERLEALNKAREKMATLIKEINHMPMTAETLRIRNRKAQIEKELTKIEIDIRSYSKAKVYVPKTTTED